MRSNRKTLLEASASDLPFTARLYVVDADPFCSRWLLVMLRPKLSWPKLLVVNFDFESALPGNSVNGQARIAEATGPNAEHFLGIPASNQALNFQKAGAYLRIADDQDAGPLDFRNGDEITLESWVRIDRLNNNANVYILGKGRTL